MRTIFSTVRAPQLPALTVGSLAITATCRPAIVPSPVMTPSAGSSSARTLAKRPSSTNDPASSSRSSRSRAVSLCCSRSLGRYRVPPLSAASGSLRYRSLIAPRGRRPAPSADIWAPRGPIRLSASALLARAYPNALVAVLGASYGWDHLDAQISRRLHQSPPLELRLAFFEERQHAFLCVLGHRHPEQLLAQVLERGSEVHVLLLVESISSEPHHERRLLRELLGDLVDRCVQQLARDHPVHESHRLHLRRGPAIAQHHHLEQHLAREASGQYGLDHHRPDADLDLRRGEGRGVGGDQDVARAGDAHSAGERRAVDAADDRFPETRHQQEEVDKRPPGPFRLPPA